MFMKKYQLGKLGSLAKAAILILRNQWLKGNGAFSSLKGQWTQNSFTFVVMSFMYVSIVIYSICHYN